MEKLNNEKLNEEFQGFVNYGNSLKEVIIEKQKNVQSFVDQVKMLNELKFFIAFASTNKEQNILKTYKEQFKTKEDDINKAIAYAKSGDFDKLKALTTLDVTPETFQNIGEDILNKHKNDEYKAISAIEYLSENKDMVMETAPDRAKGLLNRLFDSINKTEQNNTKNAKKLEKATESVENARRELLDVKSRIDIFDINPLHFFKDLKESLQLASALVLYYAEYFNKKSIENVQNAYLKLTGGDIEYYQKNKIDFNELINEIEKNLENTVDGQIGKHLAYDAVMLNILNKNYVGTEKDKQSFKNEKAEYSTLESSYFYHFLNKNKPNENVDTLFRHLKENDIKIDDDDFFNKIKVLDKDIQQNALSFYFQENVFNNNLLNSYAFLDCYNDDNTIDELKLKKIKEENNAKCDAIEKKITFEILELNKDVEPKTVISVLSNLSVVAMIGKELIDINNKQGEKKVKEQKQKNYENSGLADNNYGNYGNKKNVNNANYNKHMNKIKKNENKDDSDESESSQRYRK